MKYWTTPLGSTFSIDIYLDTNILEYLILDTYPNLTKLVENLTEFSDFINLKTTRYTMYEFCEIRKRYYFQKLANTNGETLSETDLKEFNSKSLDFEAECIPIFLEKIEQDLKEISRNYNLEIVGEFDEILWSHTLNMSLRSKLSREDCFVIISALMPNQFSKSQLLSIITNDKHFNSSFHNNNTLTEHFKEIDFVKPIIWYIRCNNDLDECFGRLNLTDNNHNGDIDIYTIKTILRLLVEKHNEYFIGKTFKVAPQLLDIVGLEFDSGSTSSIQNDNRIVIISKNLDFILLCPHSIELFCDRNKNKIELPFSIKDVDCFTFQFPNFDDDTIQGKYQTEIFSRLKEGGDYVFLLPI